MSAPLSDGGPAFPQPFWDNGNGSGVVTAEEVQAGGMTLRDYFASTATPREGDINDHLATALLDRTCPEPGDDPEGYLQFWADARAKLRYIEADAMLKARTA